MSVSVMSPVPSWRTLIRTSSDWIWPRAWVMAPSDPETSAFRMIRSSLAWPSLNCWKRSSRVAFWLVPALEVAADAGALGDRSGRLLVCDDAKDVAGLRDGVEAEEDRGRRRTHLLGALADRVLEGLHLAVGLADDDHVPDPERAGLHHDRGHRAPALVHLGLDDRADGGPLRVGDQLLEVRDEQDHLEELLEADPRLRADGHHRDVAAVLLDDHVGPGELGLDPVLVGIRLVDLVEGDDDRDLGGPRVADRLERLGHDPVVRRDHDHRDVGDPGAARTHRRERLVTRRVEEDDLLAVLRHLGGADVLGDPASLAGRDRRAADRVEEARLAVVDVAHHGDDRRARHHEGRVLLAQQARVLRGGRGNLGGRLRDLRGSLLGLSHLVPELRRHEGRGVTVDELVDRREDPALDQLADDVRGVHVEQLRRAP